jgi:hypothetical protein
MNEKIHRAIAASIGTTLLGMLIIGSFLGALHDPQPHGIPMAIVGPAAGAQQVETALGQHAPGAFDFTSYASAASAQAGILHRQVDGAFVLNPGHPQLMIASAAGRFVTDAITTAFQGAAAATRQSLAIQDVRPLPAHDLNGVSPLFYSIALILPAVLFGIVLSRALGRRPGLRGQLAGLAALAAYSALLGAAATWVADGLVGALTGAPLELFGIGAFTAFAVSTSCAAVTRWGGLPAGIALAMVIVPVGLPASGGPFGPNFPPRWYAHIGIGLPPGATMPAVRNIVYFSSHGLASPLRVLLIWAVVGLVAMAWPLRPGRPQESEPARTQPVGEQHPAPAA